MSSLAETFVTKSYDKKGKPMKKGKAHPGFKAVQKKIAARQGVGMERAGAILAAGARKAGKKAVKANPRLKRVAGVKAVKKAAKKGSR